MKISVIIPVYNRSELICETLKSLCAQTRRCLHVICVDDGSEDASVQVIEEFAKMHSNQMEIEVISIPHSGVSVARNVGIEAAKTEYVAFLDSDDLWEQDFLSEEILETLEKKRKQPDMMGFGYQVVDEKLQLYPKYNMRLPHFQSHDDRNGGMKNVGLGQRIFMAYVYRKQFLDKGKHRFPEGIQSNEDIHFLNKCLYESEYTIYDSRCMFLRRKQKNSLSSWRFTEEGKNNMLIGWQNTMNYFVTNYPEDKEIVQYYKNRIQEIQKGINL